MLSRSNFPVEDVHSSESIDQLIEPLVEAIWQDLNGQVTYERIQQVVREVADAFQDAAVTAFVPVFVHRQTRDKLKAELSGKK